MIIKELNYDETQLNYDDYDELFDEAYTNASLMNVRNQLMNKLGDDFDVIGGSTVPKVKITPRKFPELTFDITVNGCSVEVMPTYNNIPDYAHKIKGIAYMQAANTIYDFIMRTIKGKNESIKLRIRE